MKKLFPRSLDLTHRVRFQYPSLLKQIEHVFTLTNIDTLLASTGFMMPPMKREEIVNVGAPIASQMIEQSSVIAVAKPSYRYEEETNKVYVIEDY
jgi:hypothetical protein